MRVGDRLLSLDRTSGRLVYSEVILFLDRNPEAKRNYLRVSTSRGRTIKLTPSHLLLRLTNGSKLETEAVFAEKIELGDHLLVRGHDREFVRDRVTRVEWFLETGVYAPLTRTGTVVVDDVLASCYAVIQSQTIAHLSFAPFRLYMNFKHSLERFWAVVTKPVQSWRPKSVERSYPRGIHIYANILYAMSDFVVPSFLMYQN